MTANRYMKVAAWGMLLSLAAPAHAFGQAAQQPAAAAPLTRAQIMSKGTFENPTDCQECHTQVTQNRIERNALDFVLLTEYATWKTQDKHAQAYAVLLGSRGRQMQEILHQSVTEPATGCLNCHAMNYLTAKGPEFKKDEGVSCGGCHGPSQKWKGEHAIETWRAKTPEEKAELGMMDLRHPTKRAELCLSCHVGDAIEGKVITHAMYAAGHPPLPPMEIATFSLNLPQHWRNAAFVPYFKNATEKTKKDYHLETLDFQRTRSAIVGAVVAFRTSMQMIADRTDSTSKIAPAMLWPELTAVTNGLKPEQATSQAALERWPELAMAHSDCYGCHHELRSKSWRQTRGYGYILSNGKTHPGNPGRPQTKQWPIALLELAAVQAAQQSASTPAVTRMDELNKFLIELIASVNAQPFGDPKRLHAAATQCVVWSNRLLRDLERSDFDRNGALASLNALLELQSLRFADYESARQCASLLRVIYDDLRVHGPLAADKEILKILDDLWATLDVQPFADRPGRQKVMTELLSKLAPGEDFKSGMEKYLNAIGNIDNPGLQLGLRGNRFLEKLNNDIGDRKLTEMLRSPGVIDELQKSSDIELKKSLDVISNYDPDWFYKQLQELKKLLK